MGEWSPRYAPYPEKGYGVHWARDWKPWSSTLVWNPWRRPARVGRPGDLRRRQSADCKMRAVRGDRSWSTCSVPLDMAMVAWGSGGEGVMEGVLGVCVRRTPLFCYTRCLRVSSGFGWASSGFGRVC